jgi:ubiquitin-conjugating enzyme E2 M
MLIIIFKEPNPDDPLNREAAEVLKTNVNTFRSNVTKTMRGEVLSGVQFDRVLIK